MQSSCWEMARLSMSLSCLLILLTIALPTWCSSSTSLRLGRPFELEICRVKSGTDSNPCLSLSLRETQHHKDLVRSLQDYITESRRVYDGGQSEPRIFGQYPDLEYIRFYSYDQSILWSKASSICGHPASWSFPALIAPEAEVYPALYHDSWDQHAYDAQMLLPLHRLGNLGMPPPLQITPLISSGPSSNRIDLVFFSDGYTEKELNKFITDSTRLAQDISNNQSFATIKPLLNFWAAFSPSKESGIGIGGKPKDTTFGLYRDGTELRGVYYSKPEIAHAACFSMGDSCDYPILLGNDPLYGGLGGRFTVVTSSIDNGALVLRHELGHSVIDVGEEYDGGFAYFGVNAAQNVSEAFPWAHWLTENTKSPREERSVMPIQAYPWTLLNTSTPWSANFNSSGAYSRYVVRFSLSGIPKKGHLKVDLDGRDLNWTPRKDIGVDRWHYDSHQNLSLDAGEHIITFTLGQKGIVGTAQLCSMEIIEFGSPDDFNATEGYIGAFPTFSELNHTTYRPTNEGCLMRIVTTPNFCDVCLEGLWLQLLRRVELIDGIQTGCYMKDSKTVRRTIEVILIPLAQFRREESKVNETYIINWSKNGENIPAFANQTTIETENAPGNYSIEVQFSTDEVRVDKAGYLRSTISIALMDKCFISDEQALHVE